MINLTEMAESNIPNIESDFDAVKDNPSVGEFADHVQKHARVSINRNQRAIKDFIEAGIFRNAFEVTKDKQESIEKFLANAGWPPLLIKRRIRFSDSVLNGRQLKYGALNIGSYGTVGVDGCFGYYCIVFNLKTISRENYVFCCKSDMLYDPFWDKNGIDIQWESLFRVISPISHVGMLAAIKHTNDLINATKDDWPDIVIGFGKRNASISKNKKYKPAEDFIEVAFFAHVGIDEIKVKLHPKLAEYFINSAAIAIREGLSIEQGYTEAEHNRIVAFLRDRDLLDE